MRDLTPFSRTVPWFMLCRYFHVIAVIVITSEKEPEFAQGREVDSETGSMGAVGLHVLFSAFPYVSWSLLYSETRCDKLPGAGLAEREAGVSSAGSGS